ncbi:MAG: hypothetical protein WCW52_11350 [Elusimicrobiales bacterium]|jgi:hypothetical protein
MKKIITMFVVVLQSSMFVHARGTNAGTALESEVSSSDLGNIITIPTPDNAVQAPIQSFPGATVYDKMKNLFNAGIPVTQQDVIGWYGGRYANNANKNILYPSLLTGYLETKGGSLFDGELRVAYFTGLENVPDQFDYPLSDYAVGLVNESIAKLGSEFAYDIPAMHPLGDKNEYRKAQGYIVVHVMFNDDSGGISDAYGYNYKNVTPNQGNAVK